jgi:MFS transporter, FHS family, glucose/mannose:H+ symporter
MLMSFLGAVLPAWGYHLRDNHLEVGWYFLALGGGLVVSYPGSRKLLAHRDIRFSVIASCVAASAGFLVLAIASPPVALGWRLGGVALLGMSAGVLNASGFQAISRIYEHDPVSTVNMAGVLFGMGCLTTTLAVWGAFYVYSAGSLVLLFAIAAAFAAALYRRSILVAPSRTDPPVGEVVRGLKSPGAVLFTLILFFQFGNEWTLAGWLPVFLVQRVGLSPDRAILLLAVFWLALLLGRVAAQGILAHVRHGRLLVGSAAASLLGCVILGVTNNYFGCWVGTLLAGAGFSTVYPLVVEKIGHRFPDYHPGFYNGLLSFGIGGGLLVPFLVGLGANWWGIGVVMAVPSIGIVMVFVLLSLLWLETRLTGGGK